MISRMLLVWPRCVCWEYAEAQHRSTTNSPMVEFSTAVSSGYYGSTGRVPAAGVNAAASSVWQLIERLHTVPWVRNSRGEMRDSDPRDSGFEQSAAVSHQRRIEGADGISGPPPIDIKSRQPRHSNLRRRPVFGPFPSNPGSGRLSVIAA